MPDADAAPARLMPSPKSMRSPVQGCPGVNFQSFLHRCCTCRALRGGQTAAASAPSLVTWRRATSSSCAALTRWVPNSRQGCAAIIMSTVALRSLTHSASSGCARHAHQADRRSCFALPVSKWSQFHRHITSICAQARSALAEYCRAELAGVRSAVHMPAAGETVDVSEGCNAFRHAHRLLVF